MTSGTPRIATYQDALAYLYGRTNLERSRSGYSAGDFKLDRMRELLARLGDPQERLGAVHIAGTKGKGSTAAMTAAILGAAGYRVGLFTSPHVTRFEERMTVGGAEMPPETVVRLTGRLADVAADMDRAGVGPTFFELTTAMAWLYFTAERVDAVVLEVGLGGRLDATNVCRPLVCVITTISRDHTELLGRTLEEIAAEKAGIIKPGAPVVLGRLPDGPRRVVRRIAEANGSRVIELGGEVNLRREPAPRVETPRRAVALDRLALFGEHQYENAALAVAAADALEDAGFRVPDEAVLDGLEAVRWPLRCEVVRSRPTVVLDAAHNWASAGVLARTVSGLPASRRLLVFAVSQDKDARGMLRRLLPVFDAVILTAYQTNPRAVPPDELADEVARLSARPAHVAATPEAAWSAALQLAGPDDLICVSGSFFIASEIRPLALA